MSLKTIIDSFVLGRENIRVSYELDRLKMEPEQKAELYSQEGNVVYEIEMLIQHGNPAERAAYYIGILTRPIKLGKLAFKNVKN